MTFNFVKSFIFSTALFITSIAQGQIISTVAGDGYAGLSEVHENIAADSTGLNLPAAVAADKDGNIYIADQKNNRIRKVNAKTGLITTVAGDGTFTHYGFSGDGGPAAGAELNFPGAVTFDAIGNMYIADTHNQRVRKVDAKTTIITTVAGDRDNGYSGDGGAATDAQLSNPSGVAVDAADNIFISDGGNNRIREVDAKTGIITTIAGTGTAAYSGDGAAATSAQLNNPWGIAIDASGTIYFADNLNNRVRKISDGTITTVAGNGAKAGSGDNGPATSAQLNGPNGVVIDASGAIYFADSYNNKIRKVSGGIISTIAGNGNKSFSGDGQPATSASLNTPYGLAIDASGNLYIADNGNNRIRKVRGRK